MHQAHGPNRRARRLPTDQQWAFGFSSKLPEPTAGASQAGARPAVVFLDPSPSDLRIGNEPLVIYLRSVGLSEAIEVREITRQVDYAPVIATYKPGGRSPIHPAIFIGLFIYGLLQKAWSLRDLERLARRDVGAFYICGGLQPDFTTIAKFFSKHAEFLTEELFVQLTAKLVAKMAASNKLCAGDGTVIQAAASHYRALKREAAEAVAKEAAAAAAEAPSDAALQSKAEAAKEVAAIVAERVNNNEGRYSVRVAPSEPDAVYQPLKGGPKRMGYKPSILVNEHQLIVGQRLHASSELAALEPLLDQHCRLFGAVPSVLAWDAAMHAFEALEIACRRDLNLLTPGGSARAGGNFAKGSQSKTLPKSAFKFDEMDDCYLCPQGRRLERYKRGQDSEGKYVRYRGTDCADCPARAKCTKASDGRTVLRYEGDDLKDAMSRLMQHPQAREQYSHRRELVEPVFAVLKGRLGLTRFHRRGQRKVAMEFALVCVAYNVRKAGALQRQFVVLFLCYRVPGFPWHAVAAGSFAEVR